MQHAGRAANGRERSAAEADVLIVAVLQQHADLLLRVARRHSICDDDAADAYQRGLEIFLRNARRLDAATAHRWLCRVVRNEALAVREQRVRHVPAVPVNPDRAEARHEASPEEQVLGREQLAQATEALLRLKDAELHALCLQASGRSYAEIAAESGWTRTKVNRALVEGRRRLLAQCADIDSGRECERWGAVLTALVAGEATAQQLADVRPHLRNCTACRARVRHLHRDAGRSARPQGGPGRVLEAPDPIPVPASS